MLPLSIRKFTILLPSKILRLLNHTGSLPLIMLQPCSSTSGRIWEAIFRILHASSSQMVFHSIHLHVAWISAMEYKTWLPEEYTHHTLWVGVLLGINLPQGNIQYIKSFGIEYWVALTIMQPYFKVVLSGAWHWIPLNSQWMLRSMSHKGLQKMLSQGVLLSSLMMAWNSLMTPLQKKRSN